MPGDCRWDLGSLLEPENKAQSGQWIGSGSPRQKNYQIGLVALEKKSSEWFLTYMGMTAILNFGS